MKNNTRPILLILFFFQHQQQVATAVERAKQVTMTELNAIIGVSSGCNFYVYWVNLIVFRYYLFIV